MLYTARRGATPSAPVCPSAPTVVGAGLVSGGGGDRPTGARPKVLLSGSSCRKPADAERRDNKRRGKLNRHEEDVKIYVDPEEDEVFFRYLFGVLGAMLFVLK
jgi:hypothetical protein